MIDDGSFKLGEKTSFVVIDYTFGQGNDNAVMQLLDGAIDGVSGAIAKSKGDGMEILTRQATIGIRGTKFFVGEMNEDDKLHVAHWSGGGVHVKNSAGEVFIGEDGHGTVVHHDDHHPAPPKEWHIDKKKRAMEMVAH
jgi:hypothetical protein